MELKREALRLYAVTDRAWLNGRTLDGQVEDVIRGGAGIVRTAGKGAG